jgi:hypothetical protein
MDSFRDAVELKPCGHVFCKECAQRLTSCAICRKNIVERVAANLLIRNMALKVPVLCDACQWVGSREASQRHRCGEPSAAPRPPAAEGPAAATPTPLTHPPASESRGTPPSGATAPPFVEEDEENHSDGPEPTDRASQSRARDSLREARRSARRALKEAQAEAKETVRQAKEQAREAVAAARADARNQASELQSRTRRLLSTLRNFNPFA